MIYLASLPTCPPRCFNFLSEVTEWWRERRRTHGEFEGTIEVKRGKVCPDSSVHYTRDQFGDPI